VNLISIKGDECNIDALSILQDLTGGNIERVSPVDLTKNFSNMLSKPVIATNVVVKVKLHKGLQFRNELPESLSDKNTKLVKDMGNVTEDNLFTFEYTVKSIKELLELEDVDMTQIKELPFQAQIEYTALNGDRMMRVLSKTQVVSNEREELEKYADSNMLMRNCVQQSAKIARHGDTRQAQVIAKGWNRKMRSNLQSEQQINDYQNFNAQYRDVYNELQSIKEEERNDNIMMS